jgi:hypothetical protein
LRVVVEPPAGLAPGTYAENLVVGAGNDTQDSHLALTVTVDAQGNVNVQGAYTQGSVQPSVGQVRADLPVAVLPCDQPVPPIGVGVGTPAGDGGEDCSPDGNATHIPIVGNFSITIKPAGNCGNDENELNQPGARSPSPSCRCHRRRCRRPTR